MVWETGLTHYLAKRDTQWGRVVGFAGKHPGQRWVTAYKRRLPRTGQLEMYLKMNRIYF